jgi:SsrA-binding protein
VAKGVDNINIQNRRASYDYAFLEKFTAGIILRGTEIKSVREGKVNLGDGFCFFRNGELFIRNMHINEYEKGSYNNHQPLRERKLLLNKSELQKLERKLADKGLTIVPIRMFISESGYAKLEIALAKGKKSFDKRQDIKKKDIERETARRF